MDKKKLTAIQQHNAKLVDNMAPLLVIDKLTDALSVADVEKITETKGRREQVRELIAILFRKRDVLQLCEKFLAALDEVDDTHKSIADDIRST
uniref:Caspase recruitment domain-containing protein n=1 Tax=Plectus sambesii TaxID=2011161 RepID=A0A914WJB6_9BILA